MVVATIGLDISKHVFHVHAVDAQGQVTGRQRLRRGEMASSVALGTPSMGAAGLDYGVN